MPLQGSKLLVTKRLPFDHFFYGVEGTIAKLKKIHTCRQAGHVDGAGDGAGAAVVQFPKSIVQQPL